jgi:hypothetical protein
LDHSSNGAQAHALLNVVAPAESTVFDDPRLNGADRALMRAVYKEFAIGMLPGMPVDAAVDAIARLHARKLLQVAFDESADKFRVEVSAAARREGLASAELAELLKAPLRLERKVGSSLHKLEDAIASQSVANCQGFKWDVVLDVSRHAQVFAVEHDWAGAFAKADGIDDGVELRLPFEFCCFEFRISGHNVCVLTQQTDQTAGISSVAVECAAGWLFLDPAMFEPHPDLPRELNVFAEADLRPFQTLISEQLNAILIALDAKVATTNVVRIPEKLQRSRRKRGRSAMRDYHVVQLTRRARPPADENICTDRAGPRLHFRRGHWRHFEAHRTWINWTLVGDPDLGFIEKHYRL